MNAFESSFLQLCFFILWVAEYVCVTVHMWTSEGGV